MLHEFSKTFSSHNSSPSPTSRWTFLKFQVPILTYYKSTSEEIQQSRRWANPKSESHRPQAQKFIYLKCVSTWNNTKVYGNMYGMITWPSKHDHSYSFTDMKQLLKCISQNEGLYFESFFVEWCLSIELGSQP